MIASARREMSVPAFDRLAALGRLNDIERLAVATSAERTQRSVRLRSELSREGEPQPPPMLVLSGWAARVRMLSDGRRQILGVLLSGDLIGIAAGPRSFAPSTIVALTEATLCNMPRRSELAPDGGLAGAYDLAIALDEHYLLAQVTRLGRLSAYERISDFLLEINERLKLAGLSTANCFRMPLTQELLGDTLGLTSVHVNRTLQALRKDGVLETSNGMIRLHDPARLAEMVDHREPPARPKGVEIARDRMVQRKP